MAESEKRYKQLNIRISEELEEILTQESAPLKWTKTKLANEILMDWAKNRKQNGGAIQFINNNIENINIY